MTADNPAARVDLDALELTLAEQVALSRTLATTPRGHLDPWFAVVKRILVARLTEERVEAEIAGQMKHITAEMVRGDQPLEAKEELIADLRARLSHTEAERDEARADRDALRERIDHWCAEWSVSFPGRADHLRAALADPGAS